MSNALLNPAKPDAPSQMMAVVLTADRTRGNGKAKKIVASKGEVIKLVALPAITSFQTPPDAKLIPAGALKVGDLVSE
jgi:hypothetical protein